MNTITEDKMADRATVTFHTSPETKARLDKLAQVTRRSKSFLTNEAVEQFLNEEEAFVADVAAGIEDIEAGRTLTTADLRASVSAHISEVHKSHKS